MVDPRNSGKACPYMFGYNSKLASLDCDILSQIPPKKIKPKQYIMKVLFIIVL